MKIYIAFLLIGLSAVGGADLAEPVLRIDGDYHYIDWRGEPIVELHKGRYLRFRGGIDNDRWIGDAQGMIKLDWSYTSNNTDYSLQSIDFSSTPASFSLVITAGKPNVNGQLHTELCGGLMPGTEMFEYELGSRLSCSLALWRQLSAAVKDRPDSAAGLLEPLNYFMTRASRPVRLRSAELQQDDLYDCFVRSADGVTWQTIPMMHVTCFGIKGGYYPAINYYGELPDVNQGGYFGFLDAEEGGWITQILQTCHPIRFAICWMNLDVHHYMPRGVPPLGDSDVFEPYYRIRFTPKTPAEAGEILSAARSIPWRSLREYQVPAFSRDNTFDRLVGEKEYAWINSDYYCYRDVNVGYDDTYSIAINRSQEGASCWYGWCWGPAYEQATPLEGVYRFSAVIKTHNLQGTLRMGISEFVGDNWYGRHEPGRWTHDKQILTYVDRTLSGTHDWTRLEIILPIDDRKLELLEGRPLSHNWIRRAVFFEQIGKGQCWIDNVKIEPLHEPTSCEEARSNRQVLPGDISGEAGEADCVVNIHDVALLAEEWMSSGLAEG